MYCKIFASLYQGTLRGHSDEILVFTNLLAHADKDGFVDKHFKAIAEETGLNIDRVKLAIEYLESPDADSRSPEEEGARIVRVDVHRIWGWRVVNYVKYRQIRNADDRREQNRIAQERFRKQSKQSKPRSAIISHNQPQSAHAEAEAEAYADNSGCGTKPPQTAAAAIDELVKKNTQGVDDAKDFELSGMDPNEAMALLEREHPDIDVWGEFRKLSEKCKNQGTKPTWRGFVGWLRKASPVARIPKKQRIEPVLGTPDPEQELQARTNAIRTLKEWRESGASYQGIKKQLNGQEGAS